MRKTPSVLIAMALVLGAVLAPAAEAGKRSKKKVVKTTRPVSADYTASGSLGLPAGSGRVCIQEQGCVTFVAAAGEKYVSLQVADATGTPSPFLVSLGGGAETVYCGETSAPIWLNGATEVSIAMASVALPDCAGFSTSGTISGTFSNLP